MYWLRNCPRCSSDLFENGDNGDNYDSYIDCFQRGHYLTAAEEADIRYDNFSTRTYTIPLDMPIKVLEAIAA